MPSTVVDDVKLRIRIAHTMIPVLKTNGKLKLTDKNKADIAATLARTFVLDLKVADNIAVPLAYVGYTGEITVGTLKFKGVSELLASRLADTVEWGFGQNVKPAEKAATVRDIRKGVLSAFAKLKNGNTAVTIIAALKNPKVIGPTESMLCETALNTLGLVGGMESVEYLLVSELLKSSNLKIRGQAWESLSVVIKRVYDAGYYEHLIGKEKALNDAEPANLEGSAKSDCVAVKLILQEAKKALSNTITALKARIKELDPKDPAKSAAALVFINGEIAKNKTAVLLELVEALNPTTANTKPVTDAVRKILAVRLNVLKDQDIKTRTYEQIKALTAK